MNTNQAFEILKKAGSIQSARIILQQSENPSRFRVLRMARQLRHGVPVAKIVGEKWFYGLKFYTNKWTLDPRPDTETLVEAVLKDYPNNSSARILDMGTGTGCIIGALAKKMPRITGVAIDKSYHAVHVARRNMHNLGICDRINVIRRSFESRRHYGPFDIIVSNPPYIASDDDRVDDGARQDPSMALYAKNNGLAAYETIARRARDLISESGKIYLEIGADQGIAVRDIFIRAGWSFIASHDDLGGIERVLVFQYQ